MDLYLWKESKWEDANEEAMRSCNRSKGRVCTKKGKGISIVKRIKGRGAWVCQRIIEESVYQTLKVISNGTSIYCRKKE